MRTLLSMPDEAFADPLSRARGEEGLEGILRTVEEILERLERYGRFAARIIEMEKQTIEVALTRFVKLRGKRKIA